MATFDEMAGLVRAHLAAGKGAGAAGMVGAGVAGARRVANFPLFLPVRVELVLSNPEHRLIVYGTLMPRGQYHYLMAGLAARWERCTIRGSLGTYRGYPFFKWNPGGERHPAWLITSAGLPAKYRELDDFEGEAYTRRLIPAVVGNRLVIAYIYEGRVRA